MSLKQHNTSEHQHHVKKENDEKDKKRMWTDYGQQNDRQSLRKDFNPKLTKSKVYSYNGEKCH